MKFKDAMTMLVDGEFGQYDASKAPKEEQKELKYDTKYEVENTLYLLYTIHRFFLSRKLTIEIKVISNAEHIQLSTDNIEKGFTKIFYVNLFNCSILALVGIYMFLNTMV
ncbi:hypothetical protein [Staphylococcus simulans]|uniref:hypothetical protein n=1 Tax=Staphylococcus simulans TaxID=1286 RepID=UPI000D1F657A|nr:hypothetical protein [Staphylococcus simulans]PTJ89018.1 hypothetical protein BU032_12670 [Staphylococcus simulans]